jgi:cytochrome d ubiquinol oxidase subunit II
MAELVLAVMLVSATLYAVLGGADFGAGLIEQFVPPEERDRIEVAIAPVWEVNHVWLVLLATLALVGFPRLYALVTSALHIPLLLMLLGIVARGSAFTIRHYDPTPGSWTSWYTLAFRFGSLLAPLSLGLTLAATAYGELHEEPTGGFYATYVAPWNTWFGWAAGAFVCALFAFQGAALLAAEHPRPNGALPYLRLARNTHLLAIALGAHVLVAGYVERRTWLDHLLRSPLALACVASASLLVPVVAYGFRSGLPWLVRGAMGAQVASVLVGFFSAQYPVLVRLEHGALTLANTAAPAATLRALLWAIAIGLCAILPGVVYLIRVYKHGARPPE